MSSQEAKTLPEEYKRLVSVIPRGQDNAITMSHLLDKLGESPSQKRNVHEMIASLIQSYDYPIGSSSNRENPGIFIIETEDDLSVNNRTLQSRAQKLLDRMSKTRKNFNNRDQLEFF